MSKNAMQAMLETCSVLMLLATCSVAADAPLYAIYDNTEKRWGFIDRDGQVSITPRFDQVSGGFSEGLCPVSVVKGGLLTGKTHRVGYIDDNGRWVIRPMFDDAESFSQGYGLVKKHVLGVGSQKPSYGFVDEHGHMLTRADYVAARGFSEGLAAVCMNREQGTWCYINQHGDVAIDLDSNQGFVIECGSFHEGLALVTTMRDDKRLHGYIDVTGKFSVAAEFIDAGDFSEGLAPVTVMMCDQKDSKTNSQYSGLFIRKDGSVGMKLDSIYDPMSHLSGFSEGLVSVKRMTDERWTFLDVNGEVAMEKTFDPDGGVGWTGPVFCEGLCCVKSGDKYGYIDRKGRWVIEPSFDQAFGFENGLAAVWAEDKMGYVDKRGQFVWKQKMLSDRTPENPNRRH